MTATLLPIVAVQRERGQGGMGVWGGAGGKRARGREGGREGGRAGGRGEGAGRQRPELVRVSVRGGEEFVGSVPEIDVRFGGKHLV